MLRIQPNTMFQLAFFDIVRRICENEPWTTIFKNEHQSNMLKRGTAPTRPQHNRALCEYVQYTYPGYFGIKLRLPHHSVRHRNRIPKDQQQELFFE